MKVLPFLVLFAASIVSVRAQSISPFLLMGLTQHGDNATQTLNPFFTVGADLDALGNRYIMPRIDLVVHTAPQSETISELKFGAKAGYSFRLLKPYGIIMLSYPLAANDALLRGVVGAGVETANLGRVALLLEVQFDQGELRHADGFILQGGVKYSF